MNRLVIRKSVYNEIMALLEKSMRDRSKLMPKVIIDKNGHARKVYVRMGLPIKKQPAEGGKVEKQTVPVQHDGEYVLTSAGSRDFGEIKAETGLPEAKIRLRIGKEEGAKGDYGEKHLERPDRLAQLRQNGYNNARDLVEYVASDYDAIFLGKGKAITIARSKNDRHNSVIYVELKAVGDGEFYDVTSGIVSDKRHLKNKRPLWKNPKNGL